MKNFLKSVYFTYFLASSLILAQDIDVNAIRIVDGRAKTIMEYLYDDTRLVPTKVFDNVYCIGSVSVVAWAITTSDGIILIDSMWDDKDAQMIEESFIKLGLNPNDLKYIVITMDMETTMVELII
jgi:metallo-beta-lactamase